MKGQEILEIMICTQEARRSRCRNRRGSSVSRGSAFFVPAMVKKIRNGRGCCLYKAAVPLDAVKQRIGGMELKKSGSLSLSDFPASCCNILRAPCCAVSEKRTCLLCKRLLAPSVRMPDLHKNRIRVFHFLFTDTATPRGLPPYASLSSYGP